MEEAPNNKEKNKKEEIKIELNDNNKSEENKNLNDYNYSDSNTSSNILKKISENNKEPKELKLRFFKRLKLSIFNLDKYHVIAQESIGRSIIYLLKLILLFSVIFSLGYFIKSKLNLNENDIVYKVNTLVTQEFGNEALQYMPFYVFIYTFILEFIEELADAVCLGFLGYIISKMISIPLKAFAVFSISASSLTLPLIIKLIYILVNIFTGFVINNFQLMYALIAYIYVIFAVIILKSTLIKNNLELNKNTDNKKENTEANS